MKDVKPRTESSVIRAILASLRHLPSHRAKVRVLSYVASVLEEDGERSPIPPEQMEIE